jgi:hypothetical protein
MTTHEPPIPPLPLHTEPRDLPVQTVDGSTPAPVLVHTELGVPIYFSPQTREFSAQMDNAEGRGSEARLHSQDFSAVLSRIRQRCLVVPVEAYLVSTATYRSQNTVEVQPCTVLEYHPKRNNPYVVSAVITHRVSGRNGQPDSVTRTRRIFSEENVYLPTPEQIETLREAVDAVRAEEDRHRADLARLRARAEQARNALTRLDTATIKSVQESRRQQAIQAASLGAVVYDLHAVKFDAATDEEGDDEDDAEANPAG